MGDARSGFVAALAVGKTGGACFGLAMALWWLGENHACVERCSRAYALFRESGDAQHAAQCAVWLAIRYKANFANSPLPTGRSAAPNGCSSRGYRMSDLDAAEELTEQALGVARAAGDVDLELVALAQLGLVRVGKGDIEVGFGLIDEAMAAVLAGERSTPGHGRLRLLRLLNACELASDFERAAQWCQVADDFVARSGCPSLYAECRIYHATPF